VEQIRSYMRCADQVTVRSNIVAVQNQYDIINGEAPDRQGVLDFAKETGISFVAWSPLARGLLTERYLDVANVGPGDRLYDEKSMDDITGGTQQMMKVQKLASLAKAWSVSLSELVIAYMLCIPGMGPVIPSSSTVDQLRSNARGGKLVLTDQQKEAIYTILKK